MDRQLAERMVGAACLLAVLVLVVPAILDGNPDSDATIRHPEVEEELDLRTHTIRLDGAEREPPVPTARPGQAAVEPPAEIPPLQSSTAEAPTVPAPAVSVPEGVEIKPAAKAPEPRVEPEPEPESPPVVVAEEEPAATAGGDWIVQLGSFASRANAERLAADVKSKGFSVEVRGGGGSSGKLFRVRAGSEPDKAAAEALAARLSAAGFKGGRVGRK